MKKTTIWSLCAVITAVLGGLGYYLFLPALNVFSQGFWGFLLALAVIFTVAYLILSAPGSIKRMLGGKQAQKNGESRLPKGTVAKILLGIAAVPLVVLLVGNIISSTFFNATKYSNIITVTEAVFEDDMPESDLVTNIPLMDSQSANIIGNRTLGALSEVVSQYQVNGTYAQINYGGIPRKVSNLEYVDLFKWVNNRKNGVPGFVMVDPVNSSAEYIQFEKPMKYVDSAYFGDDLNRKLRFSYPTKIFGSCTFELDEAGNPYINYTDRAEF